MRSALRYSPHMQPNLGENNARDAIRNSGVEARTPRLITIASDLYSGWDDDCIPYGGDGNASIKDILNSNTASEIKENEE